MSMTREHNLGREAFLSIQKGELKKFKKLIADPKLDLTITDHCDARLENELGGDWSKGGRYENNTLLSLALSLERLDFADALIKIHKQTGRDIGLSQVNDVGVSPLHMLLMVSCIDKLKLKNNKLIDYKMTRNAPNSQDFDIEDAVAIYSDNIINQARKILPEIWRTQTDEWIYKPQKISESAIDKIREAPAWVAMDVLNLSKKELNGPWHQAIRKAMTEAIISKDSDDLKEFIRLLQEDTVYRILLKDILTQPISTGSKKAGIFHLLDHINGFSESDKLSILLPIISPDMHALTNLRNETLLSIIQKDFPSILESKQEHKKSRYSYAETKESKSQQGDVINEYAFSSQHKFIFSGAVACTSISMAMASRLLKMNDEEFFNIFNPTKKPDKESKEIANLILGGCVQTGVDLNKKVSHAANPEAGFFKKTKAMLTRKSAEEVQKGIQKLSDNFGGVTDLVPIGSSSTSIRVKESIDYLPSLQEFRNDLLKTTQDVLKEDNMFFVATAAGHTTSYFSRSNSEGNRFYYLIDSANTFISGKMEVYHSWDSLAKSLLNKWGKDKQGYAEITTYTLTDAALRERFSSSKHI